MNYLGYPEYQDSEIEWIGKIPLHWDVHRLKWSVTSCANGVWGNEPDGVDDVVCVRVADFNRDTLSVGLDSLTLRAVESKQLETRKLKRGDLLIEKSGGGEKQLVGCVVYFDHDFDAVCSNFVARMPIEPAFSARYWCYVHAGLYAGKLNYPAIKQSIGIQNLDADEYLNTLAAYPPPHEQQQIAAFLDWKTGQIDALIAKKKELMEKLKEKRLAVITKAVTKGLNPAAPLRDSGIPWLGAVPENWEVKPVKYLTKILRGQFSHRPRNDPAFYDGDYPFVQTGDIARAGKYVSAYSQTLNERGLSVSRQFPAGTLVMTIAANIGDMAIIEFPACFPDSIVGFIPEPDIDLDFLYYMFIAMKQRLMMTAVLNTQLNLNIDRISSIETVSPPHEEQKKIVEHLDREIERSQRLMSKAESAIARLTEYRTALITAATTGKIDVRQVAVPAPT